MKKALFSCLLFILTFTASAGSDQGERRGLFVSLIQEPPVLSSRQDVEKLIDFSVKARINTLFVQVYRQNTAWFLSKSTGCTSNPQDASLQLLIARAHANGIQVYAWFNTLSLGFGKNSAFIKKYGPGVLTTNARKKSSLEDYKIDDQYFLEPGDLAVREELGRIMQDALAAYPQLDGVLLDYIRYPDKDITCGRTAVNMQRFMEASGARTVSDNDQAWKDWKRAQVTGTLEYLAGVARASRPGIGVAATGCMPYARAYHEAYQDWPSWLERGSVDFVAIMDYSADPKEFGSWIAQIKNKVKDFSKVNICLGAYKLVRLPDKFDQEYRFYEKCGSGGFVIFHYGSLLENPRLADILS